MKILLLAAMCLGAAVAADVARADDAAVRRELAPTGKLRVAIAVSPSPSALYVVKDASGQYRGVTVDLGTALAKKLGVPLELVP
jgi:polar amino acid transport system substrate-binding protein